jgi:fructan beta-fructosidase
MDKFTNEMKKNLNQFLTLFVLYFLCFNLGAQDILLADFEQNTYQWLPTGGTWTVTGTAFGTGPVQGATVASYLGSGLVKSDENGYGTIISPSFTIQRGYIRFLIGGGNWSPQTAINLIVDGQVVRKAVGMGDREDLDWLQWNVSGLLNQTAQIQIVDNVGANENGEWRRLSVDQITATDASLLSVIVPNKNYLLLPVKTGAVKRRVELVQEGLVVREMKVELSTTPDFWAFIDMTPYLGKELMVRLDSKLATSTELQNFFIQSDVITTATPIYEENLRPIYHYSAKRGFLSDPNDLVYKNGEYHMGYQHNQFGWAWDNMTHGHAVSTDLVHWTELAEPIVETYWGASWNGSSVIDTNNSAGFGAGSIVTIYTAAAGWADNPRMSAPNKFSQALAYSTDNGRTFDYYEGGPVLSNIYDSNHDPVVFWYEPGNLWVMILYVGDSGGYHIYNSTDLKNWTFKSTINISNTSEVPDLFPLAVDGNASNVKWVFSSGYRQYIVGTFDGSTFTQEYGPFWYGRQKWDMAAALTFNNTPDGRRIMMSNGRTEYPGMPFNRYMNLPSVLSLKTIDGVPKLHINPVAEVSNLRISTQTWDSQTLNTGVNLINGLSGEGVEMEIVFIPQSRSLVEFRLGEFWVAYNARQNKIGVGSDTDGGQWRSLSPVNGQVHIRAFYDRGSWEVFANGGELYYPRVLTPKAGTWPLTLNTSNASIEIVSLSLHKMGSMWSDGGSDTNNAPTPSFAYSTSNLIADFDGSGSSDSDGSISSWVWDFGDGTTGNGEFVSHAYSVSGNYTVTLTVTDDKGATGSDSHVVSVSDGSGGSSTMHVSSIVEGEVNQGQGNKNASATVIILDDLGNPVGSATVTGTFSGDFNESQSGNTGSDGSVKLITNSAKKGSLNFDFCVDDITHSSFTYDAAQNVITCTGASGAKIGNLKERKEVKISTPCIYRFYPNPVSAGYFMIDRNAFDRKRLMIQLFDLTGKEVFKKILPEGENRINLSRDFSNGIYQLVIKGNDTTYNERLMVIGK